MVRFYTLVDVPWLMSMITPIIPGVAAAAIMHMQSFTVHTVYNQTDTPVIMII